MTTTNPSFTNLDALVDHVEPVFDEVVVEGSDDELFASGYLRGHFDLVAAQLALNNEQDPAALWPALSAAIEQASHELTPADQVHVANLYKQLQRRAGLA
ncbi:MAG: YfcL family protein [Idiomarina sp.]|nr:YfcL family protein [Idiomarina sp.]